MDIYIPFALLLPFQAGESYFSPFLRQPQHEASLISSPSEYTEPSTPTANGVHVLATGSSGPVHSHAVPQAYCPSVYGPARTQSYAYGANTYSDDDLLDAQAGQSSIVDAYINMGINDTGASGQATSSSHKVQSRGIMFCNSGYCSDRGCNHNEYDITHALYDTF